MHTQDCVSVVCTQARMSKNKTTEFNNNSLYLCQAFRFISCPDSFRQEQNVMFELLQVQFLEIYRYILAKTYA